jgi:hypothetical protein
MADPVDMIVPLLREIRAENGGFHEQTRGLIRTRERRLGAIEEAQGSHRQALTADSLLSKLVPGEFEEPIDALEGEVRELENQK